MPTGGVTNPGNLLKEADGMEFRFSYFPSMDRLRLLVLQASKRFTKWEASLRRVGSSDVLTRYQGALPMPPIGETVQTPPLADGRYELALALVANDGKRRN